MVNQFFRFMCYCFCCVIGSYLATDLQTTKANATTNPTQEEISVRQINIVDNSGNSRIQIGFAKDNSPTIAFFNKDNKPMSYYCATDVSSFLTFYDAKVNKKLMIGSDADTGQIYFFNESSKCDMGLASINGTGPAMYQFDKSGTVRMAIAISSNQPRIGMFDENKRLRVMFGMSPEDSAVLGFVDKNGYPELALARYFDKPLFMLTKPGGDGIYASKAKDGEPVLFHRENRKIDWSIPAGQPGRAGDLEGLDPKDLMKGMLK